MHKTGLTYSGHPTHELLLCNIRHVTFCADKSLTGESTVLYALFQEPQSFDEFWGKFCQFPGESQGDIVLKHSVWISKSVLNDGWEVSLPRKEHDWFFFFSFTTKTVSDGRTWCRHELRFLSTGVFIISLSLIIRDRYQYLFSTHTRSCKTNLKWPTGRPLVFGGIKERAKIIQYQVVL